ncbi:hypothetical protein ACFU5O_22575 [Streptomyces sp. NPDC057445]|uniref:hypothetical protein n=1 Tax=Streptomyces sp. NPDC057445 TaxID=3346136 RepID=UPI0036AC9113
MADCQAFPAGDFTDSSPTARFSTGDGVSSHCLSIAADDHGPTESLQLRTDSGTSPVQVAVLDASGNQTCGIRASQVGWTTCHLTRGVAYTVQITGNDAPGTYTLSRRDVTATAEGCAANPATVVGGASTGGTLGLPGVLVCRQVTTADAEDVLHLDVRDALGTANVMAYDEKGESVCQFRNRACAVTGSTRYQVLVGVPTNLKAAASYRFDALRIATAAGPAAECTKVPNVSYGYGPVTGTLDEKHTAVCAALPTSSYDSFDVPVTDTAGATETAVPALYDANLDNNCFASSFVYVCGVREPFSEEVSPSILVLGLPEKASQTSYRAELVCKAASCGVEKVTVGTVAPVTGVSGTKVTVTVTGTALHKDHKVDVHQLGTKVEATTTSVSPDRKTLTAVLDLAGVAPGTWSIGVVAGSWQYSRGMFTVTAPPAPAPVKSTAAPKITGTAQVGAKLTAAQGTWAPAPTSYAYQWKANGTAITGATASTYTVPASLLGKKLTVTVTARRSGHADGTATSAGVTVARGAAPKASKLPVITGTVKVGRTLTASRGTWAPAPTSYTYQWYANGTAITGATRSTLVLRSAQRGKKITVKVTAARTGHSSGSAVSRPTGTVAR